MVHTSHLGEWKGKASPITCPWGRGPTALHPNCLGGKMPSKGAGLQLPLQTEAPQPADLAKPQVAAGIRALCSPFTDSLQESSVLDTAPSFQKLAVRRGATGRKPQSGRGVAPLDYGCGPMGGLGSFWAGGPSRRESRAWAPEDGTRTFLPITLSRTLLTFYAESPAAWGVTGSWEKHWGPILLERKLNSKCSFPKEVSLGMPQHGGRPRVWGWFNYTGHEAAWASAALREEQRWLREVGVEGALVWVQCISGVWEAVVTLALKG